MDGFSNDATSSSHAGASYVGITPERLAVDTGYAVPSCPRPSEQTPTSDARQLTDPNARLASVSPGGMSGSVLPDMDAQGQKSLKISGDEAATRSDLESAEDDSHLNDLPRTFSTLQSLLEANRAWADRMIRKRPDFFSGLASQQTPQLLWIGCSDSRVPANQIVNLDPGEVFVHRNVANIVTHTDLNALSVLQYAVDVLQVKHVIVCGHYGCGGVLASMTSRQYGLIDNWIRVLKDLYAANIAEMDSITDSKERADLLCELNVAQSVRNVCASTIIQNAWVRGQSVAVHGWCYRIDDGIIRDLNICVTSPAQVQKIYTMVEEKIADIQINSSRQQSSQELPMTTSLADSPRGRRRSTTIHEHPSHPRIGNMRVSNQARLLRSCSLSGSFAKVQLRPQIPIPSDGTNEPVDPAKSNATQNESNAIPMVMSHKSKGSQKPRALSAARSRLREPVDQRVLSSNQ